MGLPSTTRRIVVNKLSSDFRSATSIIEEPVKAPGNDFDIQYTVYYIQYNIGKFSKKGNGNKEFVGWYKCVRC